MLATRVRFAPSPTGPLHIGGLRTALYNYLFAKKHQGTFVLRLEDTDQSRFVEGAETYILEALRWTGIFPDEGFAIGGSYGPYKQSERKEIYFSFVQKLIEKGFAYYAFDKMQALEKYRNESELRGETFIYNATNREKLDNSLKLNSQELNLRLEKKEAYVIRFKVPAKKDLKVFDEIRGKILINTELLDDKILLKSDGMPTYHLASVVDDHLMKISHVIRGEEWLPSLSLHFLLNSAFGWEAPKFIHLPLILNSKGAGKLSKRDAGKSGAFIFPLNWQDPKSKTLSKGYKEGGFFPESLLNMLALLGWNPGGEKEIFDLKELINEFSLEKISKSGARFDPEKAIWINNQHLQKKSLEEVVNLFCKEFPTQSSYFEKSKLTKIINEIRPRANFIYELYFHGNYFFEAPKNYEEKALLKIKIYPIETLKKTKKFLEKIEDFSQEKIKKEVEIFAHLENLKFAWVVQTLRVSVVGALKGADLFFILEIIGKSKILTRIKNLISYLESL